MFRHSLATYGLVAIAAATAGAGGVLLVTSQRQAALTTVASAAHDEPSPGDDARRLREVAGTAGVYIAPARQQLIGVRTADVAHQTIDRTVRTVGTLAWDETRVTEIHTKIAGWVERVDVDFVGKPVRRGQPLLAIYSPELVATQKEYLLALKAQGELGHSQFAETRIGAETLVGAARERLRLWDMSDEQIAQLEERREVQRTVTLYSPFDGIVMERKTFAGQYITPDMSAVKIADLSTIWAIGEVFEYEMAAVRLGQAVTVQFPYGNAARPLTGRVAFIYPDLDPQTRRGRVRIEFANPGLALKPGAFVTLIIRVPSGEQLAVPREAVIDTGSSQYVVLARENGYFEPRAVSVGAPAGDYYPVSAGLSHGDRVVTSAQFLVDSETNLRAALKTMAGHGHAAASVNDAAAPVDHSGHRP